MKKFQFLNQKNINELVVTLGNKILQELSPSFSVYGIPRGGSCVAYLLAAFFDEFVLCDSPEIADVFVDDIIDSGNTRSYFKEKYPEVPFYALIDDHNREPDTWYTFAPWEMSFKKDGENEDESATDIPTRLLQYIGEDPTRDGLKDTPKRFLKAWRFLTSGYNLSSSDLLSKTFKSDYDEMVILKDIEFYSMCEHHMLPFFGKVHIAYIPNMKSKKVVGISKLARLVEVYARRLQIQERMTSQIAGAIEKYLEAHGVAVYVEAQHLCMVARGVQKQNSKMLTSDLRGALRNDSTRMEFLLLSK